MIEYYSSIFDIDIINSLITNIPWQQVRWKGNRTLPRLVASLLPEQLVSYVPETISIIDNVRSCWLNLYRDGNDYTPYHRDSYNCKVLNISFGGIRRFSYKNLYDGGEITSYDMKNGDCIMFDQVFNDKYVHTLTKTKKQCLPRVSIVLFVD